MPLLIVGSLFGLLLMGEDECGPSAGNGGSSVSIDPASVPETEIAGYGHEQLVNAAYVMQAGKDLGLNARDQTIGVMTAMGESSLRNIDYGDWETGGVTNPDGTRTTSIGLFQQQDGWGTREERLDPYISSTKFFNAMTTKVPDRESLEPTIVAHRTQVNADPYHYTKFWDGAVQIVEGLSGVRTGLDSGDGSASGGACEGLLPGEVSAEGWASPGAGPVSSPYGIRVHPIYGTQRLHAGTDLAGGGCDGPICFWVRRSAENSSTSAGVQFHGSSLTWLMKRSTIRSRWSMVANCRLRDSCWFRQPSSIFWSTCSSGRRTGTDSTRRTRPEPSTCIKSSRESGFIQ
ncbi:M23 family peptidase [Paenarthrobacter ureafaciens]|uniref:M23 family peptidase n=1 Tax=Paenarthrobacter ureafaciens TaxID=37931 RepID=UPI001A985853